MHVEVFRACRERAKESEVQAFLVAGDTVSMTIRIPSNLRESAKSLLIDGMQLIHYNTAIAERMGKKIILNYTCYSLATVKAQKMIADAVDPSRLVYVSSVPSDTRSSFASYLPQTDFSAETEPDSYLLRIEYEKYGMGYVTSIEAGMMTCKFGRQEKTLMYPMIIDSRIVKIIEDKR